LNAETFKLFPMKRNKKSGSIKKTKDFLYIGFI
jgi:hypothetical protein